MYLQRHVEARLRKKNCCLRKINNYYIFLCVRACPGAWACTRARASVVLLTKHATRMRHMLLSFVSPSATPHLSTLPHKRHDIRKK
jgi:hypothetical protein